MRKGLAAIVAMLAHATLLAAAPQSVQLTIQDGRVWLVAYDATASQILAEWARVGQTAITNGDRLPGARMTLELAGIPERQALDLVLRSASGFVATTRPDATPIEADRRSQFERIVIVATSNAPAAAPAAPTYPLRAEGSDGFPQPVFTPTPQQAPPMVAPGVQRVIGSDGRPVADDQEGAPERAPQPPPASLPPGFAAPPQTAAPPEDTQGAPAANAPRAPQGVAFPGMIVAMPVQPGQPGQPVRPPR
jgi:hypothetical protein